MNEIATILMVCLGNTARSPVAEYLAKYYAKKHGVDLSVDSAGFINAFSYMQPESQEYLNSKGIDHLDFEPKIINRSLLKNNDLIITMETSHKIEILNNFHDIKGLEKKVFTLKEFNDARENLDILDPYYTSSKTYGEILEIIDENVEKLIEKVIEINKST